MIYSIFSVYDSAAKAYTRPFLFPTEGMAKRYFMQETVNPDSPVSKSPADYTLFHIGEFDDQNG